MNHQQATNEPLFLTTKEVLERYRIKSKVTLWKWRKEAGFPEPIHNGRHYAKDSLDKWDALHNTAAYNNVTY